MPITPPAVLARPEPDRDGVRQAEIEPAQETAARTFDSLIAAIGDICDPDECWNYFKAAGYVPE